MSRFVTQFYFTVNNKTGLKIHDFCGFSNSLFLNLVSKIQMKSRLNEVNLYNIHESSWEIS